MNFFAQQDRARRKTFWLLLLLVAAVVCLIFLTVLVTAAVLYLSQQPQAAEPLGGAMGGSLSWWEHLRQVLASDVLLYAAGAVLLLVISGSLYKTLQLGGSGRKVAEALGGRPLAPNTTEPDERKVLNVVEEMAIASGNPVPHVYILDDDSINAFAAGSDRRNAVIGVTRGCVELLSRDELQGVIAHEFSHIHFGDMRINLRLVAALHGILLIGLIGSFLLRSSMLGGRNKNRGVQVGLGLTFVVLGYSGIFFGGLIKAAVSRQREFLADASAVQFTRNPEGIANALKKIGGLSSHALLSSPVAAEYSHLYFGQGIKSALGRVTATHPPLQVRIKKIQPQWDGNFIRPDRRANTTDATSRSPTTGTVSTASAMPSRAPAVALDKALNIIGNPSAVSLTHAHSLLQALPASIIDAARDPFSARALVYSLLIDRDDKAHRGKQVRALKERAHPATYKAFELLLNEVRALPRALHLPLLDLAMPALKSQSTPQYQVFKENLIALIKADERVSLFEWCLYRIAIVTTEEVSKQRQRNLRSVKSAIEIAVAAVCYSGKTTDIEAAYRTAETHLPGMSLRRINGASIPFQQLDEAVAELASLKPSHKPQVLKALAACIHADDDVRVEEMELFRAIADCLDCPVPLATE